MDRWSFIFGLIGVLALLLAIPLSIAANLLTPKLKDWWATTSDQRRQKRIVKLQSAIEEISDFRSPVFRQEMFLFGMRWLVMGLLTITSLIFMVFSDVLRVTASLDQVKPIFSGFDIAISGVAVYRFEAVLSLFIVALTAYCLRKAFKCFRKASRFYAHHKLEEAEKELSLLKKYFVDNSTSPQTDKPESRI